MQRLSEDFNSFPSCMRLYNARRGVRRQSTRDSLVDMVACVRRPPREAWLTNAFAASQRLRTIVGCNVGP